jgi:hypothetical protein
MLPVRWVWIIAQLHMAEAYKYSYKNYRNSSRKILTVIYIAFFHSAS